MFFCQTLRIHHTEPKDLMLRRVFLANTVTAIASTLLLPATALAKPSEEKAKKEKDRKHKSQKSKDHPSKQDATESETKPVADSETTEEEKIAAKAEEVKKHKSKKSKHPPDQEKSVKGKESTTIEPVEPSLTGTI